MKQHPVMVIIRKTHKSYPFDYDPLYTYLNTQSEYAAIFLDDRLLDGGDVLIAIIETAKDAGTLRDEIHGGYEARLVTEQDSIGVFHLNPKDYAINCWPLDPLKGIDATLRFHSGKT